MKVLIFEGIATSGKSTVTNLLKEALSEHKVIIVSEDDTHIPIMKETSDKHIDFFKDLINRMSLKNPDILIFDRLYLTQAFRTKCDISDYAEVEELLDRYSASTIFLKVDENAIENRILKSSEHRGPEYFESRGKTSKERAQYYIDQQKYQLGLLEHSILPYRVLNTTNHDYSAVVKEVLSVIDKNDLTKRS